jgi:hypothetical protein
MLRRSAVQQPLPNSNFKYTVDWIQTVRFHLSCVANDLEDEEHMKVLEDLIKDEPYHRNSVSEWVQTAASWHLHRNNKDESNPSMAAYDLYNDRSALRSTIKTCYAALKREEQKISDAQHDEAYYYPPEVPTQARKVRSNQMIAHLNEFIRECRALRIKVYQGDEVDYTVENWIQFDDEAHELVREGCPIIPIKAQFTPEQGAKVSKRFTDCKSILFIMK